MGTAPTTRLRRLCLALPEAVEKETWGEATFRIREKIFATASRQDGRPVACIKAAPGMQGVLIEAAPERFYVPPYLGGKGWVGIRLDVVRDWGEVENLVRRSYLLIAPRRIALSLDQAPAGAPRAGRAPATSRRSSRS
ncbi:MAG: MmcQ/YjbR family DNA-binding protein [Alphaproteobacteria bacterium]|nr:MmcQ/YjbR family DNA-binding protein [Alphaproteobacteria bacterium]